MRLSRILAKLKDKFTIKVKVQVPCYSPGACPNCGALVDIPMTRTPWSNQCPVCRNTFYSLGLAILDMREDRLKYVYDETVFWVRQNSQEYTDGALKKIVH